MASIFTKIINGEIPSHKVAETDHYYAFLDINPLTKGHTLAIPKKEVDYIFDLDEETYTGLMQFARKVGKAIEKTVDCNRIGVTVMGLEVPHAHVHLIPMNNEGDMSFAKQRVNLTEDEFETLAAKIATNYEKG